MLLGRGAGADGGHAGAGVPHARLRLLPLALALAAAAITFGALSLAGGSLTMASIAALPVLIGLAVDYAIQFQARFDEAAARGRAGAGRGRRTTRRAHDRSPPGLATATGFLVLLLSPVPMVRGFGALLVVGIVSRSPAPLCAGFAALTRFSRPRERAAAAARCAHGCAALARTRVVHAARGVARRPRRWRALGVRAVAAAARARHRRSPWRWSASRSDTQTAVISDVRELVPQNLQALRDVDTLQKETGVSGEIDVTVRADDITDPRCSRG